MHKRVNKFLLWQVKWSVNQRTIKLQQLWALIKSWKKHKKNVSLLIIVRISYLSYMIDNWPYFGFGKFKNEKSTFLISPRTPGAYDGHSTLFPVMTGLLIQQLIKKNYEIIDNKNNHWLQPKSQ